LGHFKVFPANSSLIANDWPHWHATLMGMVDTYPSVQSATNKKRCHFAPPSKQTQRLVLGLVFDQTDRTDRTDRKAMGLMGPMGPMVRFSNARVTCQNDKTAEDVLIRPARVTDFRGP
jgi:hypothetical protein